MLNADFTPVRGYVTRERSELIEGPAGTFQLPEPAIDGTIQVFWNGQACSEETDNGVVILAADKFRFKATIDGNPSYLDDVRAMYSPT